MLAGGKSRFNFSTARDCPFAWLLAREATRRKDTYTREGSRNALLLLEIYVALATGH